MKTPLFENYLCPFRPQVSVNVSKKTLLLYNINEPDSPIELAFQTHYGSIVAYKW